MSRKTEGSWGEGGLRRALMASQLTCPTLSALFAWLNNGLSWRHSSGRKARIQSHRQRDAPGGAESSPARAEAGAKPDEPRHLSCSAWPPLLGVSGRAPGSLGSRLGLAGLPSSRIGSVGRSSRGLIVRVALGRSDGVRGEITGSTDSFWDSWRTAHPISTCQVPEMGASPKSARAASFAIRPSMEGDDPDALLDF